MRDEDIATADDCYDTAPVSVPRVPIRAASQPMADRRDPYAMPTGPRFGLKASTTVGLRANVGIRDEKQGA